MKNNFIIVLFNNKEKKKIIKRFYKEKNAVIKFEYLLSNNDILFEKKINNTTQVNYELGLLTNISKVQKSLYTTDEMGRNQTVNLEDPNYIFLDIKKYKIEETIFDCQKKIKITFKEFIFNYCNNKDLKNIFTLNNKICVQIDLNVFIFSLKNKSESDRFLSVTEDYFYNNNRSDALFVKDVSTTQRKWLYDMLENKGFNRQTLYRQKTTYSKR